MTCGLKPIYMYDNKLGGYVPASKIVANDGKMSLLVNTNDDEALQPRRSAQMTFYLDIEIDSLNELREFYTTVVTSKTGKNAVKIIGDGIQEKPIVTSTGCKVPKRNPKAKAWVSPYGNRRK